MIESIECTGYEQRLAQCNVSISEVQPLCHDLATVGCGEHTLSIVFLLPIDHLHIIPLLFNKLDRYRNL